MNNICQYQVMIRRIANAHHTKSTTELYNSKVLKDNAHKNGALLEVANCYQCYMVTCV